MSSRRASATPTGKSVAPARFNWGGKRYPYLAEWTQGRLASLMPASWNQIKAWLRTVDELRRAA